MCMHSSPCPCLETPVVCLLRYLKSQVLGLCVNWNICFFSHVFLSAYAFVRPPPHPLPPRQNSVFSSVACVCEHSFGCVLHILKCSVIILMLSLLSYWNIVISHSAGILLFVSFLIPCLFRKEFQKCKKLVLFSFYLFAHKSFFFFFPFPSLWCGQHHSLIFLVLCGVFLVAGHVCPSLLFLPLHGALWMHHCYTPVRQGPEAEGLGLA